jgi:hypothetical protein
MWHLCTSSKAALFFQGAFRIESFPVQCQFLPAGRIYYDCKGFVKFLLYKLYTQLVQIVIKISSFPGKNQYGGSGCASGTASHSHTPIPSSSRGKSPKCDYPNSIGCAKRLNLLRLTVDWTFLSPSHLIHNKILHSLQDLQQKTYTGQELSSVLRLYKERDVPEGNHGKQNTNLFSIGDRHLHRVQRSWNPDLFPGFSFEGERGAGRPAP